MIADKLGDSVLLVDSPFATTATSVAGEHIWFVDSPFIVRAALLPSSAGIKATSQNGEAAHRQAAHHPLVLQGDSARRTSLRDQIEFFAEFVDAKIRSHHLGAKRGQRRLRSP